MKAKRFLTLILSAIFFMATAFAQTSGDKLYNEGLKLQKTMTVSAQNSAISKFKSAKKIYDSAAKKAQCDQAISVSQNIISQLKSGSGGGGGGSRNSTNSHTQQRVTPMLEVSNTSFDIPNGTKTLTVSVNTNQSWNIYKAETPSGVSFIDVKKTGDNTAEITVPENDTYDVRTQSAFIIAGDLQKEITITQAGRPVALTVSETAITFKAKGGNKALDVMCNSDQQYDENSYQNWYVESKPDWIMISLNAQKKSGGILGMVKDKANEIIKGKDDGTPASSGKITSIKVICDPSKGTRAEQTGRKGQIVLRSGNASVTIDVTQNAK